MNAPPAPRDETADVVEAAFDAYVSIDQHGRVIAWNRQAEATFGWTRAEMLGHDMAARLIPPDLRAAHARGLAHYLVTGEGPVLNRRIEVTAQHRDGRIFPVEMTIWPVGSGPSLRFSAFLHDVSERAAAERRQSLQRAVAVTLVGARHLQEVGSELLAAIGQALDWEFAALWLPEGDTLRCASLWHRAEVPCTALAADAGERAFAAGVGLPGRVWGTGAPAWIVDVQCDTNFPRAPAAAADGLHAGFGFPLAAGGRCLGVIECLSKRAQAPDAALLETTHVLGSLIGQFIEREQAQAALVRHAEDLARSNRELEEFTHMAAHDLNEPLRTLASFSQLLGKRYGERLEGEAREFLEFIVAGAQRMQRLIAGLLLYSRAGRGAPLFQPIEAEAALVTAKRPFLATIAETGAVLTHDPLPVLLAERVGLEQVFANLIGNALKFRGPAPPRIHISAARDGEGWRFTVADNGIGIDPAHAERIFGIFQRLERRDSSIPGDGVGLTVARKIVQRHGGRLWVESELGHGARFHFRVPDRSTATHEG